MTSSGKEPHGMLDRNDGGTRGRCPPANCRIWPDSACTQLLKIKMIDFGLQEIELGIPAGCLAFNAESKTAHSDLSSSFQDLFPGSILEVERSIFLGVRPETALLCLSFQPERILENWKILQYTSAEFYQAQKFQSWEFSRELYSGQIQELVIVFQSYHSNHSIQSDLTLKSVFLQTVIVFLSR